MPIDHDLSSGAMLLPHSNPAYQRLWNRVKPAYPVILALLALGVLNLEWSQSIRFPLGGGSFSDPDTVLRLTIVKSMHDGTWQPGFFSRNDAPFGMVLHWSSLFSWMLLGAARLLWFLPFDTALLWIGLMAGPCLAALCLATAYVSARPLMPPAVAAAFALTAVTSVDIVAYSQIGTASHHILILWLTLTLLGAAVRIERHCGGRWPAAIAGISAGLGLWVSFESLIFIATFFAYACLLWIMEGKRQVDNLRLIATLFCGVALAGILVDPPYGGYASIEVDRLSLSYVFAAGLQLGSILIVTGLPLGSAGQRLACFAACGVASLALQQTMFPIGSLVQQFNYFVMHEWNPSIGEFGPVRHPWHVFEFLGNGIIGVPALAVARNLSVPRKVLYGAALTALGIGAYSHIRYSSYFLAMGAFAAFYVLHSIRHSTNPVIRGASGTIIVCCSAYLLAGNYFVGSYLRTHPHRFTGYKSANCKLADVLPVINEEAFLRANGPSPIFAIDLDRMPEFLFGTSYRTLAGNYHGDARGINDIYLMMRDFGWESAHAMVEDHHVDFMLLCPTSDRDRFGVIDSELYWKYSTPDKEFRQPTFYTRIMDGDLPPWLKQRQWPVGVKTDLKLFQVVDRPAHP